MKLRIHLYVFRYKLFSILICLNCLMLGSMVLKQPFNVFHERNKSYITYKESNSNESFQKIIQNWIRYGIAERTANKGGCKKENPDCKYDGHNNGYAHLPF